MNKLNEIVKQVLSEKGDNPKDSRLLSDNDDLLKRYYEATGNDPKNFNRFKTFLKTLGEAESFSGKRQSSDKSTASGLYHYLDDSVTASDNRTRNLFSKHNIDKKLQDEISKQFNSKVGDRSADMQSLMVLSDLMQSPTAPYQSWSKGETDDRDLYYQGHHTADKDTVSSKEQVYENWNNANKRINRESSLVNPNGLQDVKDYNPVQGRTKADHDAMYSNEYKMGGTYSSQQQYEEGGITEYNTGGSHQSNPNGGVPIGMGANGKMNTVQQGEASYKSDEGSYIFSDNIFLDGTIKK